MIGVKVCINWMLDNPNKKITSKESEYTLWFDGVHFHSLHEDDEELGVIRNFKTLGQYNWEEVKQPYTFLEAYEDCKENGTGYYNVDEYGRNDLKNIDGEVELMYPEDTNEGFIFNGEWFKV